MSLTKPEVYFLNDKIDTIDIKINEKIDILESNLNEKLDNFEGNIMEGLRDIKKSFDNHLHSCANQMKDHSEEIEKNREFRNNVIGAGKFIGIIVALLTILYTVFKLMNL